MAEGTIQEEQTQPEPQGEGEQTTDWKAEARKWEKIAKKSKAAEDELAKLKEAQMTDAEKANARADKAEQELAEVKAENERMVAARKWSSEEGVPIELLEFCKADDMEAFCKAFKANQTPVHAAAPAAFTRIVRDGGKTTPEAAFAAFAQQALN